MESDNEFQESGEEHNVELTKEFINNEDCHICTMLELLTLMKADEQKGIKDNEIVKVTKEYLNTFNRYNLSSSPNITEIPYKIKRDLNLNSKNKFSKLEVAQLMDLAPTTSEEAFRLIPSLKKKFKAEEMDEYLVIINREIVNN